MAMPIAIEIAQPAVPRSERTAGDAVLDELDPREEEQEDEAEVGEKVDVGVDLGPAEPFRADQDPEQDLEHDRRQKDPGAGAARESRRRSRRRGRARASPRPARARAPPQRAGSARSRRERRRDPPRAGERAARLEPDQRLAAAERVRRAGHRLDRDAAPVDVRERIAGEQHHVAVGVVQPEGQPGAVAGERSSTRAMPSSRSRSVKQLSSRVAPIALGSVKSNSVPADRRSGRWGGRGRPTVSTVRAGAVRTSESTVGVPRVRYGWKPQPYGHGSGPRFVAVVATDRPSSESAYSIARPSAERVARLRVEHVLEHDPALLALADPPAGPADEAVDRVPRLELVERQLLLLARRTRRRRPRSGSATGSAPARGRR